MFRWFRVILAASLLAVMLSGMSVALAQKGATPIAYGQPVTGTITNESPEQLFTFTGAAGDLIVASMVASQGGLDSYLELFDSAGALLASDDDGGGNLNALLGPFRLPAAGEYTIKATRFAGPDGWGSGPFTLVVQIVEVIPLSLNETVTVDLSPEQPQTFFAFSAAAGGMFNLSGRGQGGTADFNISIRDAQGATLNGGYGTANGEALIDPLIFSAAGDYTILLSRQEQSGGPVGGTVRVGVTLSAIEAQPLAVDGTVTGTLDDAAPAAYYTFAGQQADILRLEGAQDPGGAPFDVQVYGPDGYGFNGGSTAYGTEASQLVIDPLVLSQTGDYLLVVHRTDMTGQGAVGMRSGYTLTLGATRTPELVAGQGVTGTVDQVNYDDTYRFVGEAGQNVRITVRSLDAGYAPGLDVQGPGPDEAASSGYYNGLAYILSANSGLPGTATFEVTLPASGVYLFRVFNGISVSPLSSVPPAADGTGTYGLLVEVVK